MFRVFKEELPENAIICKSCLLCWKFALLHFLNISDFQFRAGECGASFGWIFLVPVRIYCFKSWNRRWKSGSSPSSVNSWIRWEKYRFFASTIHKNAWFQVCIFLNFLGRAHPAPPQTPDFYPAQSLAAPSIWASPSILGRFAPSIGSWFAVNSPPPTCLLTPPPTEGD